VTVTVAAGPSPFDVAPDPGRYHLRLFVAGSSLRSVRTIANLRRFCEGFLPPDTELEVIDIYQQPHLAERDQVVAAPTLVKLSPSPVRRIIGDLSDPYGLARAFGLAVADRPE
jgi:circadian clock protein KaiB